MLVWRIRERRLLLAAAGSFPSPSKRLPSITSSSSCCGASSCCAVASRLPAGVQIRGLGRGGGGGELRDRIWADESALMNLPPPHTATPSILNPAPILYAKRMCINM
jgi:hypothetical protein